VRKWVIVGLVSVVVLGGAIFAFASGGGNGDDGSTPLLVTADVVRRDLTDEVTVTGTLGRVEERVITASGASASGSAGGARTAQVVQAGGGGLGGAAVSTVYAQAGGTMEADQPILALDGRDSITQIGDIAFFRKLDVGNTGVDVRQLEEILQGLGYSPGRVDLAYTEQTRAALAQWQAAHLYPTTGTPTAQTVTVSLQPGTGYTVGEQSSAAAKIGPYVPPASYAAPNATEVPAVEALATGSVEVIAASVPALGPCGSPSVSITASPTKVKEGSSSVITVTASPAPTCNLQVFLTPGGDATPGVDYNSFPPTITFGPGQSSANFTLKTRSDVVTESPEHALISIAPSPTSSYAIGSPSSATVTITDDDGPKTVVTLTANSGQVPEGQPASFTVGLDDPLSSALEVELTFNGNAVEGADYNRPGGSIIVPAGQTALPVSVPTLDDGVVEIDKFLTVELGEDNGYRIGEPDGGTVVIVSEDVPKIDIVGSGSTSKGGGLTFQIFADQAPLVDTTVQYQASGTAQPGTDIAPLTGTVLLPAGATSAGVPLLTLNTDVVFIPTDMIVAHWPTNVSQVMVEEGDLAPAGTPLFSITETGFTVTLSASAADRGKLEVGQQVNVQVQGGDTTVPGVITELDDTATVNPENQQQTYEGTVQVQGDLGAADGAPVTIDVVLEEHLDVITVPIAAVKQNGEGQDVVSVIDIQGDGDIQEVVVKTGLSEGSYIEITDGLQGDEVVVVEVEAGPGA